MALRLQEQRNHHEANPSTREPVTPCLSSQSKHKGEAATKEIVNAGDMGTSDTFPSGDVASGEPVPNEDMVSS